MVIIEEVSRVKYCDMQRNKFVLSLVWAQGCLFSGFTFSRGGNVAEVGAGV